MISVKGIAEAQRALEEIAAEVGSGPLTPDVLNRVGRAIIELAKSRTPVRTGYMRSRNQMEQVSRTEIRLFNDASYSAYVNFGTSRMMSRPFFTSAIQQAKEQFPKLFVEEMKKEINTTISQNKASG